ncbi:MAG TPA: phosphotransferase family protein [Dehalococcoidia bacterium]
MTANFDIDASLVDFGILGAWMDGEGLPGGPFERVETLAGGTQNTLIRFARGGREYVLRRGPRHLRPVSNDVMRREMRVLSALAGSDVPHPTFFAGCTDDTVMNGAVFYLMEPIVGFNPSTGLPALHAGDASIRHAMGLSIVDGAAALGRVDYLAVGLDGLGRPDGFLERQVPRWLSELESYSRFEGYPGPEIPAVDEVAKWLDDNRPATWSPGIMHGDYHFANVLYRYDGPQLAAIVDWEMCTIGDPLLDLGWLLATWPEAGQPSVGTGGGLAAAGGLPSADEIVARYAEGSSRDLSAIGWYGVLACFKLGIVLEGTHARAYAGKAPKPVGDMLHATTLGLFRRAQAMISAS